MRAERGRGQRGELGDTEAGQGGATGQGLESQASAERRWAGLAVGTRMCIVPSSQPDISLGALGSLS